MHDFISEESGMISLQRQICKAGYSRWLEVSSHSFGSYERSQGLADDEILLCG